MTQLRTARLLLRPPGEADVKRMAQFAGDLDVARMTGRIPHPYTEAEALAWLASLRTPESQARETVYAAVLDGLLIGMGSQIFAKTGVSAEIGYWIGKPYWGNGYATEMAAALIRHAFGALGLDKVTISHMVDNPASAAVIAKLGFQPTGRRMIRSVARGGEVETLTYALSRSQAAALAWYQAG